MLRTIRMATGKLSELEGAVLGLVWASGPCTAYTVRRTFLRSPSPHWSGSAGTIYPIVQRLERRRLLASEPHSTGRRRSRLYRVTAAGNQALTAWMGPPLPQAAIGVPVDPLRTRTRFLAALSPERQETLLAEARKRLASHLEEIERDVAERRNGDRYGYLMARGALLSTRARLAWLDEVRRYVGRESRRSRD
jgi:DNA-binding PadR family transcriptional regulator